MKVAILGCGPSALLAGHAARLHGHAVRFLSVKEPSRLGGSQYLHKPIPELTNTQPDGQVAILGLGWPSVYSDKVYGHPSAQSSWDLFVGRTYRAWNLQDAYDQLWGEFADQITHTRITPLGLGELLEYGDDDLIINTVPAKAICSNDLHEFLRETVTVVPESDLWAGQNAILYSGQVDIPWYRTSCIFHTPMTEYPGAVLDLDGARVITKPLSTDCDCWSSIPRMMSIGRYGKWKKGVLVTDAFDEVMEALDARA